MTRAVDLLKNKFGVGQLYKYDIKDNDEVILTIHWHPLTIAEREMIQKKSGGIEDANDFALQLMIEKALDKDEKRLFSDGDKASLRREVAASVLQEIQLAMLEAGATKGVEEAEADLKS
tara:strand:- start:369 stop:725 length:357 start_codon:yes stop_codon:yes gene_type:complete